MSAFDPKRTFAAAPKSQILPCGCLTNSALPAKAWVEKGLKRIKGEMHQFHASGVSPAALDFLRLAGLTGILRGKANDYDSADSRAPSQPSTGFRRELRPASRVPGAGAAP